MGAGEPSQFDCSILTARELQIFRLLLEAKTNKVIATELETTVNMIEKRLSQIYKKLGIHSRSEAILYWGKRSDKDPSVMKEA